MNRSKDITHQELLEILSYDELTGIFIWKVSPANNVKVGSIAGTNKHGYISIQINGIPYLAQRLAWFYVHEYWSEYLIDHKDKVPDHNWISNLRESSYQCNARNSGNPKDNTSGVKGVTWHKRSKKWMAQIRIEKGKTTFLGYYSDFIDAVKARYKAELENNWNSCDLNSPAYLYLNNIL